MKAPRAAYLPALLTVVLCGGCTSPRAARIRSNAELYDALDPFSKKLVDEGLFNIGFSAQTVYVALGKPNRVTTVETDDGPVETWVYKNFLYGGMPNAGYVPRESARPGRPMVSRNLPQSTPSAPPPPAGPTIAEMADAPLATLFLDLRDGYVITARLEF